MKVFVAMGTRPEVIKLVPVIIELKNQGIETIVCVTGQHREMLQQSLDVFGITPNITLDVMAVGQSLNKLSSKLLSHLDDVFAVENPDWVIVQGDTTTAFCAGWAAFQRNIKVAHVEAGLRTGDLQSPFPEEANRSLLARIASLHFAPTGRAKSKLISEGISESYINVTGNTVVDALVLAMQLETPEVRGNRIRYACPEAEGKKLILVTCHRRENFGDVLEEICLLIRRLASRYSEYHWIFPVHLNPKVQEPVNRLLDNVSNLSLIKPVDYLTTLAILERSVLVVSDSGGIQEEVPSFGVPMVVMRNHTERQEGIDAGFAVLAGQNADSIEAAVVNLLERPDCLDVLSRVSNPYGDGMAAGRIVSSLQKKPVLDFNG
jgi:UDP-N-acetylglucosamine 2-epimerase (non-hydrolysing)